MDNMTNESAKTTKKFYERAWFLIPIIAIVLIFVIGIIAVIDASNDGKPAPQTASENSEIITYDISVTNQIVKKVDGKYRYFFDIRNSDSKDFHGEVTINLFNNQGNRLGAETFKLDNPLQPGLGFSRYIEINTAPQAIHDEYGITRFTYQAKVNGEIVESGEGSITNELEI